MTPEGNSCSGAGKIKFADFFSGIGGFRLGMGNEDYDCVFACDNNAECQKTYEANFGESPKGDIRSIHAEDVPNFDVLCAGFPCQPFSIAGKHLGFADGRGALFFELCRFIKEKQPRVVLLENVKHLIYHDSGRTLDNILEELRGYGYAVTWKLLNALNHGVPQNRERIIILASKNNLCDYSLPVQKCLQLQGILENQGDFEFLAQSEYTLIANPKTQLDSGLRFAGYRNKPTRKAGIRPGTEHLSRAHKQPNRIYSAIGTHPTLSSQESSGRYWVLLPNNQVRKLTLNECYRLMGFPDSFKRTSPRAEQYRQIGNSVCVPMIASLASAIKQHLLAQG
jgi:DNA (cytosine-5)-methyltransferase 1